LLGRRELNNAEWREVANDGAGAGQDDGQGGSGAPSGESKDSKDDKSDDGELVPVGRLKAALSAQERKYEAAMVAMRAEFEAFKAGAKSSSPQQDQPKRYTRTELKAAVSAEQITQDQADDIWAKQVKEEARDEALAAVRDDASRRTQQEQIDNDLTEYKRLAPEIRDKSSDKFEQISAEFQYLVKRGSPNNLATELAAIRAVLGPLDKLKTAKAERRAENHEEQSGGEGKGEKQKAGKKLVDTLSPREKKHYEGMIDKGHYKDWAAVEAELGFARPEVRRRQGARV
jgi:hypothetical protein